MKKLIAIISLLCLCWLCAYISIVEAATVYLTWDPVPTATGYKMYYGTASRVYNPAIDVGNITNGGIPLNPGTYFFAVAAYNKYGESDYSDELSNIIVNPVPSALVIITRPDGRETWVSWQEYTGQFPTYGYKIELDGSIIASVGPGELEYNLGELANGSHEVVVYTYNEYGQTASNKESIIVEQAPIIPKGFTGKVTHTFENGQLIDIEIIK